MEPDQVTITGAESVLEQVDRAVAQVDDVSGVSEDSVLPASLVLYDANGNELNQTQLENNLGENGLSVSAQTVISGGVTALFPFRQASRHACRSGESHDAWHGQLFPYSRSLLNDALPKPQYS